jgi:hypothetical protein
MTTALPGYEVSFGAVLPSFGAGILPNGTVDLPFSLQTEKSTVLRRNRDTAQCRIRSSDSAWCYFMYVVPCEVASWLAGGGLGLDCLLLGRITRRQGV